MTTGQAPGDAPGSGSDSGGVVRRIAGLLPLPHPGARDTEPTPPPPVEPAPRPSGVLGVVGATSTQVGRSAGHAVSVVLRPARKVLPSRAKALPRLATTKVLALPVPPEPKAVGGPGLSQLSGADAELLRMVQQELREVSRLVGNRRLRRRLSVASDCLSGIGREVKGPSLIVIPSREQASIARLTRTHRKAVEQQEPVRRSPVNPLRVPSYLRGAISKI